MTLVESFEVLSAGRTIVLFDYDSTIATVPIDWPVARTEYRKYLRSLLPLLELPENCRVDEMEAVALRHFSEEREAIFRFRLDLETAADGDHVPLEPTIELIRHLVNHGGYRLFVVSNNLHRTVESGLMQIDMLNAFEAILGVDDVGVPKPQSPAFDMLARDFGLPKEASVFVGDNERTDGGFCREIGIPFINISEMC